MPVDLVFSWRGPNFKFKENWFSSFEVVRASDWNIHVFATPRPQVIQKSLEIRQDPFSLGHL